MQGGVLLQQAGQYVSLAAADVGDGPDAGEVQVLREVGGGLPAGGGHGLVEDLGRVTRVTVQVVEELLAEHVREDVLAGAHGLVEARPGLPRPRLGAPEGDVAQAVRGVLAQQAGHLGVREAAVLGLGEDAVAGQRAQQAAQRLRLGRHGRGEVLHGGRLLAQRVGDAQAGGGPYGGGAGGAEDEFAQAHRGLRVGDRCGGHGAVFLQVRRRGAGVQQRPAGSDTAQWLRVKTLSAPVSRSARSAGPLPEAWLPLTVIRVLGTPTTLR